MAERAEAGARRASARRGPTCSPRAAPTAWTPIGSPARSRERRRASDAWPAEVHPAFVTRLLQRSREYGASAAALRHELDAALAATGQTVEDAIRSEGQHQAAEQAAHGEPDRQPPARSRRSTGASSSRASASSSRCCSAIRPRVYGRMDFRSRDRYRHAVEELAEPTGDGAAAGRAQERRARAAGRRTDAGRARGARRLLPDRRRPAASSSRASAGSPGLRQRIRRLFFRHATPGYLGAIALGTARWSRRRSPTPTRTAGAGPLLVWVALLTLVPASELTIQIVQRIISQLIPPRRLPRLDLDRVPGVGAHDGHRADDPRQRRARRAI